MMTATSSIPGELIAMAKLEEQLAAAVSETTRELSHAECFDEEQRAEMYTILEAIKADIATHREMLRRLAEPPAGEAGNV